MNLLNKLFGTRHQDAGAPLDQPVLEQPRASETLTPEVPLSTFVELEAPAMKPVSDSLARLKALSERDRTEEGRQAGYQYHDMAVCRSMEDTIRAEVLRALDVELERIGNDIAKLDREIARLKGEEAMGLVLRSLQTERDYLSTRQVKYFEQHFQVTGAAGFAERPLLTFRTGFLQGYNAYLEASSLLDQYRMS